MGEGVDRDRREDQGHAGQAQRAEAGAHREGACPGEAGAGFAQRNGHGYGGDGLLKAVSSLARQPANPGWRKGNFGGDRKGTGLA